MEELEKENEKKTIENKKRGYKGHAAYGFKIRKALIYDNFSIQSISKNIREYGAADDDKALQFMFQYHHSMGNSNAKSVYNIIMDKSGMEPLKIVDIKLEELKCPFCECELIQGEDKYGTHMACSNYRECRLRFNI